ncbi:cell envelope integrity protein TolA [Rheinheimera faecalis]|uniref:cell envelope integrity protein TolA n=1 Tax=Rheinheimera faecalis TaxID=2901141 RepID=UPI001E5B463C|nr:cell envelope integrity protein TolA [Rheinheimera faecalis]
MKPISVALLLFACVIAGLSGAILYNYATLNAAKKHLELLEADLQQHNRIVAEAERKEKAEMQRRQVNPSPLLFAPSISEDDEARRAANPVLHEKQRYLALIVAKIQQNWFVDDSMRGKECRINIKLAPDGAATSITPLGGDYNLCMSAVRAIEKAGNFPMSKDPAVYDALKDITTILQPQLQ